MKTYIYTIAIIIFFGIQAQAQLRSISAEFLGSAPLYSLQYESRFGVKERGHGYRLGVSGLKNEKDWFFSVPVGYNFLFTKNGKSMVELGAGITLFLANTDLAKDYKIGTVFGNIQAGYRSTIGRSNFYWRAVWSPIITDENFRWLYGGVSIGYQWRK